MKQRRFLARGLGLAVITTVLVLAPSALAGPPLICHPFDIGGAKSLPWGNDLGSWDGRPDYDLNHLVADTEALLTSETPVIVRMETLRRAVLYSKKNDTVARQLVNSLLARAQKAEGRNPAGALAAFDVGYLVETFKQANMTWRKVSDGKYDPVFQPNAASEYDGYAWVQKAIRLRGGDPGMEFAAALITAFPRQKSYDEHLRKAMTGATDGSLLAKNLATHFGDEVKKAAELRAQAASPKD